MIKKPLALAVCALLLSGAGTPDDALVRGFQSYLRLDTSVHEEAGAKLIQAWLAEDGIEAQLYEAAPGRTSLIARLPGNGSEKPLMLLHHIDVVAAEASRWKHPPFGAEEHQGQIWGRGSLDMKGLGYMQVEAFRRLKREGVKLRRDVILCATADEEEGGDQGIGWFFEKHPEAIACGEVLNEGGMGLFIKGTPLMGIQTAERGTFWVKATASGLTGHGSRERPDSAPRRLLRALARLEAAPRKLEWGPESSAMFKAFAGAETGMASFALSAAQWPGGLWLLGNTLISKEPALAPLLTDTINPTVLQAGTATNVIAGEASAQIDVRLLPGRTGADTLAWLKTVTAVPGDPPLKWEVLHERASSRSQAQGPLWDALVAAINVEYPGVPVMPILTPGGGTDSNFFREHGIQALGCMPILATTEQLDSMHGDNEWITREQLVRGTRATYGAVLRAAGVK